MHDFARGAICTERGGEICAVYGGIIVYVTAVRNITKIQNLLCSIRSDKICKVLPVIDNHALCDSP